MKLQEYTCSDMHIPVYIIYLSTVFIILNSYLIICDVGGGGEMSFGVIKKGLGVLIC